MIRVSARDTFVGVIINLYRDKIAYQGPKVKLTCRNTSDTGDNYGQ